MSLIRFDRAAKRLYVHNSRCHHGFTGVVLMVIGAVLAIHDRRDVKDWFIYHG